jgi:DNA-binding beta-propeller fold protein YncE
MERIAALGIACLLAAARPAGAALVNGAAAIDALGQLDANLQPLYTASGANDYPNNIGQNWPYAVAIDTTNHRLFAADTYNNRVVVYTLNSSNSIASRVMTNVLGQSGFKANAATSGPAAMYSPKGLAFDAANSRLFVSDTGNQRVLVFNAATITNGMSASYVLGQPDLTTNSLNFTSSGTAAPQGLAYDSLGGRLFVADSSNNRVLVFNVSTGSIQTGENASVVLGQPVFTSSSAVVASTGMYDPVAVAYDPVGLQLFVADYMNSRVLVFGADPRTLVNGAAAVAVLGQTAFSNANADTSGSATGLYVPSGVAFDPANGRLFVTDSGNSRAVVYNSFTTGASAVAVLGATGFPATGGGDAQNQMLYPWGLVYDPATSNLFVADSYNNRVLEFTVTPNFTNGMNAADEVGVVNDSNGSAVFGPSVNQGAQLPSDLGLQQPAGVAIDTVNHRLFVADQYNNRVVVYALNSSNSISSRIMTNVLGQPNLSSNLSSLGSQNGMSSPYGLAYDPVGNQLFVSDKGNNRVLVYGVATITNGMNAAAILGQPGSAAYMPGSGQAGMSSPLGLAYDSSGGRLFVSDSANNRLLVFNTFTTGANAVHVLGQTGFATVANARTQSGLYAPDGLAYDAGNSRLFVADNSNLRVLSYNVASITDGMNAANVLGEPDFVTYSSGATQSTIGEQPDSVLGPGGLAYDPAGSRLFVSDTGNFRVLVYNVGIATITNGMNAAVVLGQPDFVTHVLTLSQTGVEHPGGMAYDGASNLFVADSYASRVLAYNASLPPPTGGIVALSTFSISVSWNPTGSNGYVVNASTSSAFAGTVFSSATSNGNASGLTVFGLSANTTYFLEVGTLVGQTTTYASAFSTSTLAATPSGVTFPLIGLGANPTKLQWSPNGNPAGTLYTVLESTASNPYSPNGAVVTTSNTYNAYVSTTGMTTGVTYYFEVQAANNNSVLTPPASISLIQFSFSNPYPAPGNPAVAAVSLTSITVDWTAVASTYGYVLIASTAANFSGTVFSSSTTDGSVSSLTVSGLSPNTVYFLNVGSLWGSATSYASELSTATLVPPAPSPPTLAGLALSSGTIGWSWTLSSTATAQNFYLWSSSGVLIATLGGSTSYYIETPLAMNSVYARNLEAVYAAGPLFSSTATVATPADFTYCTGQGSLFDPSIGKVILQFPPDTTSLPLQFLMSSDPLVQPLTGATQSLIATAGSGLSSSLQGSTASVREFLAVLGASRYSGTFSDDVIVSVPYTDSVTPGVVDGSSPTLYAAALKLYAVDETTGAWVLVPGSTVDTSRKLVTGSVNHLSIFGAFGVSGSMTGAITVSTGALGALQVYPNPYRPGSGDPNLGGGGTGITFNNLQPQSDIRIYTTTGQLVAHLNPSGSTQVWDARNDGGRDVASGLYLAVVKSPGNPAQKKKLLIIR